MLRILGRITSINVRKVLWTAAEAGLDFEHDTLWPGTASGSSREHLALNPNGLVPVLLCGDGALWESNAICRYLASTAGRTDLLPAAPFARAQVEKWMDWQIAELNPAWRPPFMALVRGSPVFVKDREATDESARRWNALMLLLEARLAQTGAYVAGDTFTVADVVLGLSLQRWLLTPIDRPATPSLLAYRALMQARPAARRWIDPAIP